MARPFKLGAVPGEEFGPLRRSTEVVVEEEREVLHQTTTMEGVEYKCRSQTRLRCMLVAAGRVISLRFSELPD